MIKLHLAQTQDTVVWVRKDHLSYFCDYGDGTTYISLMSGKAFTVRESFEYLEQHLVQTHH